MTTRHSTRVDRTRVGHPQENRSQQTRVPGFGSALAAEWARLTTLRSVRAAPVVCALTGAAVAALFLLTSEATTGAPVGELAAFDVVATALLGIDAAAIVVAVLIASTVASEQATGLHRIVLLAVPSRGRRLAASALVVAGGALLCGVVAALGAHGGGQVTAALTGGATSPIGAGGVARAALGTSLMAPFYGTVALAFTTATRSLVWGVSGVLGLLFLPTLVSWAPGDALAGVQRWLPGEAVHSLAGLSGEAALPPSAAGLVLVAWAVAAVGTAHLATRRGSR